MPLKINVDGLSEVSEMLTRLESHAGTAAAKGLYDGAGLMADEVNRGAETIVTEPFHYGTSTRMRLPSPEEKAIVTEAGVGIAPFDKNGAEVNTSIGYQARGYAYLKGRRKPVPLIVNSINSGTSFMKKQPFIRQAARSGAQKCMKAIKDAIEAELEALTKETGGTNT
jgi:hypothetical protein